MYEQVIQHFFEALKGESIDTIHLNLIIIM